jgi:3-carboxy-cis,cis-muconate cycloisomerase
MTAAATSPASRLEGGPAGNGGGPCNLLTRVFGDPVMSSIFSAQATIESWLAAEAALAWAQAAVGLLSAEEAAAIAHGATLPSIDSDALWQETRNVGYPILPLVRMVAARVPEGANGRVHYGATTQDIMDTGLALQLGRALQRLDELLACFGDEIASLAARHRRSLMPARTHGQQAVPTTFGAKLASLLGELGRQRERIHQTRSRVPVASLYGAGGTSAALGEHSASIRRAYAERLGLGVVETPWHSARDCVAEFGSLCALLSASAARFASEVINLSRNEIGEVSEGSAATHYGASSTMPQKANPIRSETVVGMSIVAAALASALPRIMVVPHERAAGEWQAEWQLLPQLAELAAGALLNAGDVARDLSVHTDRMRANAETDGGGMLAEAYMIGLAPQMGRERAHDLVYAAARAARQGDGNLLEALRDLVQGPERELLEQLAARTSAASYLGEAQDLCDSAIASWRTPSHSCEAIVARRP